jgi:hypothetical protein
MTQHTLIGRTAEELGWFERRSFVKAAGLWVMMGSFSGAKAANRTNVVERMGDVQLNGSRLLPQQGIEVGDQIETGPDTSLVFVLGDAAFQVRQNTRMLVEGEASSSTVNKLLLLAGGVVSVWRKGIQRQVVSQNLTAGIRGTGVYAEIFASQGGRSYFCNCYGTVDVASGADSVLSQSDYHQSFWGEVTPVNGRRITPAGAINHVDEELEMLAALLQQQTAWQMAGRKGVKDGKGYMEQQPDEMHPAAMPKK